MKLFFTSFFTFCSFLLFSQTINYTENFSNFDNTRIENYAPSLTVNTDKNHLTITAKNKTKWEGTNLYFNTLDLSTFPLMSFKVKSNENVTIRIDLIEKRDGKMLVSNAIGLSKSIFGDDNWNTVYFDFTGHFNQMWPEAAELNPKNIVGINIGLNPGAPFTGTVLIDDIHFGELAKKPASVAPNYISLNQLGFYPNAQKMAIAHGSKQDKFYVISSISKDTVYSGSLSAPKYWSYAEETVQQIDFSTFKKHGSYQILVPDIGYSPVFKISNALFDDLAKASLKAFYFQRCSYALDKEYAGKFARGAGQLDTMVYIHPSAESVKRPAGTTISSPWGWYDAGDYNKYIVNSGITMYTLLSILEQFPDYGKSLTLHIPENKNALPDMLDEILYNLRWMLTMQDPNDGGVYHKLTHDNFEPMELPKFINWDRYVVAKSTAATLDFAAVMAQAARVIKEYSTQLPELADSCMNAAVKAWMWARLNPTVYYDQFALNQKYKPLIYTGTYSDGKVYDEFIWAASELYISTGNEMFLDDIDLYNTTFSIPNWANVESLGLLSLNRYKDFVGSKIDTAFITKKLLELVNPALAYTKECAYGIPMGFQKTNFEWGSNSTAANISMLLLQAYYTTKNKDYYNAALHNFDYLLGRNPLGYCYVTNFGSKSPVFLHHRPSEADGIAEPLPGFLVGGPQPGREDKCVYEWSAPAKNYADDVCSYSTNEIAINWNAPLAYLSCAFEAHNKNLDKQAMISPRTPFVFPDLTKITEAPRPVAAQYSPIIIFPNLTTGELKIYYSISEPSKITVTNARGKVILSDVIENLGSFEKLYNIDIKSGAYSIRLQNTTTSFTKTFIINRN